MDDEVKLLLSGVRVVLVGVVVLVILAIAVGPRILQRPLPYGKGGCIESASSIACATP
jgi:hypothetical protein